MPPRAPPKIFQIRVKTHKLTIFLTLPSATPLSTVKSEILSALSASVAEDVQDLPQLNPPDSTDAFELAREVKTRQGRGIMAGTGTYERLEDNSAKLTDVVSNWDALYLMLRDEDGILQDVQVSIPTLDDEVEDPFDPKGAVPVGDIEMDTGDDFVSSSSKGKRKAPTD